MFLRYLEQLGDRAKRFYKDKNWEGVFDMRTYLKKLGSASVVALSIVVTPAFAGGKVTGADYANGEAIFNNGKGNVPACSSCHGATGLGDDALGTPRLAGQLFQYLHKQLNDYASDKRTDTMMYVMNANSKGMSNQDRKDVSAYLNSLGRVFSGKELQKASGGSDIKALVASGTEIGKTHLGKVLVNFGDVKRGIPACLSCHGHNGRGAEPMYPRIGEQKLAYLIKQMQNFRDGSRTNDPMNQMQVVAKQLTDDDILNLATYLTQAPQTTPGNSRIPVEHLP